MDNCNSCKFWLSLDRLSGDCRRYPPTVYGKTGFRWPLVLADGACGEWLPAFKTPHPNPPPEAGGGDESAS